MIGAVSKGQPFDLILRAKSEGDMRGGWVSTLHISAPVTIFNLTKALLGQPL
jgi:hypothetical protein